MLLFDYFTASISHVLWSARSNTRLVFSLCSSSSVVDNVGNGWRFCTDAPVIYVNLIIFAISNRSFLCVWCNNSWQKHKIDVLHYRASVSFVRSKCAEYIKLLGIKWWILLLTYTDYYCILRLLERWFEMDNAHRYWWQPIIDNEALTVLKAHNCLPVLWYTFWLAKISVCRPG